MENAFSGGRIVVGRRFGLLQAVLGPHFDVGCLRSSRVTALPLPDGIRQDGGMDHNGKQQEKSL